MVKRSAREAAGSGDCREPFMPGSPDKIVDISWIVDLLFHAAEGAVVANFGNGCKKVCELGLFREAP
ncbi:MAG: hypothetical protein COA78_36450 [Blastopirellula sp.]|nr:MAG: hypothetical protein COA78_36450 [Blastopirellula sp.]